MNKIIIPIGYEAVEWLERTPKIIPIADVEETTPKKEVVMSWFVKLFTPLVNGIKGWFAKEIPTLEAEAKAELGKVEDSLIAFAGTDLGKLAIDTVQGVQGLAGGVGGPAFLAAKAKFIADAKTAGHDLENIGSGIVDWMIQTAYTVISGVVAQTTTPATTKTS